jgi:hypothetical protein
MYQEYSSMVVLFCSDSDHHHTPHKLVTRWDKHRHQAFHLIEVHQPMGNRHQPMGNRHRPIGNLVWRWGWASLFVMGNPHQPTGNRVSRWDWASSLVVLAVVRGFSFCLLSFLKPCSRSVSNF